ncbi:SGNH/GDSL hydrolase family protein [Streptomyces antibioticus]|uniref:SGNH/GDSL hydrolase family protein n=1 Tax=Streptomyces antibioticus TaxID=1890 RepID=UPI0033B1C2D2
MQQSVLDRALDCVVGALATTVELDGIALHRAPEAGRRQLADPMYEFSSTVPSGVRLELLTDAAEVELVARFTEALPLGETPSGSVLDLVVDGELREPVVVREENLIFHDPATEDVRLQPADPARVRLALGRAGRERRVEIWLPVSRGFRLVDVRIPAGATVRPAPPSGPVWVHHGSSISQCAEADRPTATWPAAVARAAGRSLVNLALAGECHLDPFVARTLRDLPAAAISLELGINVLNGDSMRERAFVPAFHGFLDTIREGRPDTPILVVTPIVCPAAETRPGPTLLGSDGVVRTVDRPAVLADGALTLTRIRELLTRHVEARRADGDERLHVVDGTTLFGPDDVADLPDGLHPNTAGYARIAARFLPVAFGAEGVLRGVLRAP